MELKLSYDQLAQLEFLAIVRPNLMQGELISNFRVYLLTSLSNTISKCLSTNAGVTQPFKNVCRSTRRTLNGGRGVKNMVVCTQWAN